MVMHKNNNKLDCRAVNLEFGTAKENTRQVHDDGLCCDRRKMYAIYNDTDTVLCHGTTEVLEKIEYTITNRSLVTNNIKYNTKLSRGPYAGYKIRRLEKPFNYDIRSTISP